MEELLIAVDEIAEKMKEKGYDYFNIKGGNIGTDFKTGLISYLHNVNITKEPAFPIYAVSCVAATNPGESFSRASFTIVEDAQGLRIDTMSISMCECYGGALRTSLELKIKSLNDIPSKQNAAKLIEEKWEKLYQENRRKWNNPVAVKPLKPKGRKL